MERNKNISVTVSTTVNLHIETVWKKWTTPGDIINWNNASDDWRTPHAQNDLRPGGSFLYRMESTDGAVGFDFSGVYDEVVPNKYLTYTMEDGRKVKVSFIAMNHETRVVESFDAETENPVEMQKAGWQAILDNFKRYAEASI